MNNSGLCVRKILNKYKVNLPDVLIIYDDADLPLGKIRFRVGGSCAGHRGMVSIAEVLGNDKTSSPACRSLGVGRLRIGIGSSQGRELSDYVLSDFSKTEREVLDSTIREAVSASLDWVNKGIDFSMQKYNRRGGNSE